MVETYGLDFADRRQVPMHSRAVDTQKHTQRVGSPIRLCKASTQTMLIWELNTDGVRLSYKNMKYKPV